MSANDKPVLRLAGFATLLFVAILYTAPARALPGEEGFWSIQLENDLWGSNDDRFYTNGWQFSYASPKTPPGYLESMSDYLPFYEKGETGYHGFNIGQTIFTPEDIRQPALQADDRPYAGWLYVETFIGHRYFDTGDRERINALVMTVGVVGPASLAEESQKLVHDLVDGEDPRGWDNQLENELGINGSFIEKWRHIYNLGKPRETEVSLHSGLTLGNVYTYAAAGIMARWGTHLKDDIGPPSISPGFPGLPAFNPSRRANWYIFAAVEARAMARNIFLDGNTNVTSPSVEKKDFVGDFQIGVAIRSDGLRISFSQTLRSREFEGQPEHSQYGLINFTYFVE